MNIVEVVVEEIAVRGNNSEEGVNFTVRYRY